MKNQRTARIPIFEETKKTILADKHWLSSKLKRSVTWDEFFLASTSALKEKFNAGGKTITFSSSGIPGGSKTRGDN